MRKVGMIVFLLIVIVAKHTYANNNDAPERLGGNDRFEVATNISKQGWIDGANTVILVNYKAFADALSATPLAYQNNAPILLTQSTKIPEITINEIDRLKPKTAIIIGGTGSVSDAVENKLSSLVPAVIRVDGANRFEVAYHISQKLSASNTVIVTNGLKFPDALSIAPYAARKGYPILLTQENNIPSSTKHALEGKTHSIVVGGEGSISKEVFNQLPGSQRIGGRDRFEVGVNIIKTLRQQPQEVFVATGLSFADGLTGSVLAAKENAPLVLTKADTLPPTVSDLLIDNHVNYYTVLGGKGSVNQEVVDDLSGLVPNNSPIIYIDPHADDETLSYAVDIRNELANGRDVYIVLLSGGEDSAARDILNGVYDQESAIDKTPGEKVYCVLDQDVHDPLTEHYRDGHLTREVFKQQRINEYLDATRNLGIKSDHIFVDSLPLDKMNPENIKPVLLNYLNKYPNAELRTMSMFDGHPPHAAIGEALHQLEDEGKVSPYKTKYFISIYTDRFLKKDIPLVKEKIQLNHSSDLTYIQAAIQRYEFFQPEEGYYAIGYHSVASQFNSLEEDLYNDFHY